MKQGLYLVDVCVGLAAFLALALPSIKGVTGISAPFNALAVGLLAFGFLLHGRIATERILAVLPLLAFLVFLMASFLLAPVMLTSVSEFLRYLMVLAMTLGVALLINRRALVVAMNCVLAWGVGLAIGQLERGFTFTEEFHYLTLGLPIGSMILVAFARLFFLRGWWAKGGYIGLIVLGLLALFTLRGRSPILFPSLIVATYLVVRLVTARSFSGFLRYAMLAFALGIAAVQIIALLPGFWIERVLTAWIALTGGQGEARLDAVYRPAIAAILDNPLGYGLGSSSHIVGFYPHNIWLEALLHGGFFAGWLLLVAVLITGWAGLTVLRRQQRYGEDILASALLAAFLFLTWNVSYDIPSAYGLFAMAAIVLVSRFAARAPELELAKTHAVLFYPGADGQRRKLPPRGAA